MLRRLVRQYLVVTVPHGTVTLDLKEKVDTRFKIKRPYLKILFAPPVWARGTGIAHIHIRKCVRMRAHMPVPGRPPWP